MQHFPTTTNYFCKEKAKVFPCISLFAVCREYNVTNCRCFSFFPLKKKKDKAWFVKWPKFLFISYFIKKKNQQTTFFLRNSKNFRASNSTCGFILGVHILNWRSPPKNSKIHCNILIFRILEGLQFNQRSFKNKVTNWLMALIF